MALIRGNGSLNIKLYLHNPENAHLCAESRVLASKSAQGPWLYEVARSRKTKN